MKDLEEEEEEKIRLVELNNGNGSCSFIFYRKGEGGSDYSQVHCCSGGRPFVWCRSLSNAGAPPH